MDFRLRPGASSMTRKKIPCQFSREKTLMMRVSLMRRERLISRLTRRNFFSFFVSRGLRNFSATLEFNVSSWASKTMPKPPWPIRFTNR